MSTHLAQVPLFEPMADASAGSSEPLLTVSTSGDPKAGEAVAEVQIYRGIGPLGFGEYEVQQAIRQIKDDVSVIRLRFHTRGGSAFVGFFIGNAFRRHAKKIKARIETVCDGLALSIGSYLMMLGEKRTMAKDGFLMIHTAWSQVQGNADVLEHTAGLMRKLDPRIQAAYAEHVSLSEEELSAAMSVNAGAGTWYTAEEALELGFVTDIEDLEAPDVPDDEQDLSGFKNAPEEAVARYGHPEPQAKEPDDDDLVTACLEAAAQETNTPAGDAEEPEVLALIEECLQGESNV